MITSLVWVALGLAVVAAASRLRLGTWDAPGPGFLPVLIGATMVVLAVGAFVQEWRQRGAAPAPAAAPAVNWWQVALTIAALVAYGLLLDRLGYVVTTLLVMGFLFRRVARLRWPVALTATVLSTLVSYALFALWLKVRLPRGPWGG